MREAQVEEELVEEFKSLEVSQLRASNSSAMAVDIVHNPGTQL